MFRKPLSEITEQDLQNLIDAQVAEGPTIDYKAVIPLKDDGKKTDYHGLHKDFIAFANASGGDIVIGMKEGESDEKGLPKKVIGIQGQSSERYIQQIQQSASAAIDPPLELRMHPVGLHDGSFALVIRIERSLFRPHAVRENMRYIFMRRINAENVHMDIRQIKDAFIGADSIVKQIRGFVKDRTEVIARAGSGQHGVDNDIPRFKNSDNSKFAIHLVPLNAFDSPEPVNLNLFKTSMTVIDKVQCWGYSFRYNLDGVFASNEYNTSNYGYTYIQVYRNGIFECVDADMLSVNATIRTPDFEQSLVQRIVNLTNAAETAGVKAPAILCVSFYRMGHRLLNEGNFDRNTIIIPDLLVDNLDLEQNPFKTLKPILDTFQQAAGNARSSLGN